MDEDEDEGEDEDDEDDDDDEYKYNYKDKDKDNADKENYYYEYHEDGVVVCSMGGFGTLEVPQLPAKPVPCVPAHFKSVSEYSNGSLQTMKSVAWGPYLPTNQLREEIHGQMDHVEGNAELPCTPPHFEAERVIPLFFPRSLWRVSFHHGFICSLNPEVYRSLIHEVDHYFILFPH